MFTTTLLSGSLLQKHIAWQTLFGRLPDRGPFKARLVHGEGAVKDGQTDDFSSGVVWPVCDPTWCEKTCPFRVDDTGFFPFAAKDVGGLIGFTMNVFRNDGSGLKLAEHGDTTRLLVFVKDLQFDPVVGTGLP